MPSGGGSAAQAGAPSASGSAGQVGTASSSVTSDPGSAPSGGDSTGGAGGVPSDADSSGAGSVPTDGDSAGGGGGVPQGGGPPKGVGGAPSAGGPSDGTGGSSGGTCQCLPTAGGVPAVVGSELGPSALSGWPGLGAAGYPSPIFGGPALSPALIGGGGADCCCPDGIVLWPVAATSPLTTYFTSLAFCYRY